MNCRRLQNNLFEYVDGGLSRRAQAAAKRHLEQCEACRQSLHDMQRTTEILSSRFRRDTESLTLDPDLQTRIVAAVEKKSPPPRAIALRPGFWRRFAWLSAGAALILFSIFLLMRFQSRRQQTAHSLHGDSGPAVALRISYCEPIYTFRTDGNFVIDSLNCQPRVVEETLQLSSGQTRQQQEGKSPL